MDHNPNPMSYKTFLQMVFQILKELRNPSCQKRKVGRDYIKGVIVSTVEAYNPGFETAIVDINGIYTVERYATREESEKGHRFWMDRMEKVNVVTQLEAFHGEIPYRRVKLARDKRIKEIL